MAGTNNSYNWEGGLIINRTVARWGWRRCRTIGAFAKASVLQAHECMETSQCRCSDERSNVYPQCSRKHVSACYAGWYPNRRVGESTQAWIIAALIVSPYLRRQPSQRSWLHSVSLNLQVVLYSYSRILAFTHGDCTSFIHQCSKKTATSMYDAHFLFRCFRRFMTPPPYPISCDGNLIKIAVILSRDPLV